MGEAVLHHNSLAPSRPFWLLLMGTLMAAAATAALGLWQLERAAQKQALQAGMQAQASLAPVALEALQPAQAEPVSWLQTHRYRPVRLRGRWLGDYTLFLDNRQMRQRPGFFVLTPFELASGQGVVMVQRGWTPRDFHDRARVPMLVDAPGHIELEGVLDGPPARLFEWGGGKPAGFGASEQALATPIRQNVGLTDFSQATGLAVYPNFSVRQTSAAADGLLRDWPQPQSGVHTHYGYAVQWFALSVLVAGLFVWFQIIGPLRGRHA